MSPALTRSRRFRILVLAPFPPSLEGTHGGSRAIAELVQGLAKSHAVALLYLRATEDPPLDQTLAGICEYVEEVERPPSGVSIGQKAKLFLRMLLGTPAWAGRWNVTAYATRLSTLLDTWKPDIVQVEYPVMGQYLSCLRHTAIPRVLTVHDPGVSGMWDRLYAARGLRKAIAFLNWLAWRRFEPSVLRMADAVVVFTERDRRTLTQLAKALSVKVIPLGIALPERTLTASGTVPPNLLFVGNFAHPPNYDAAYHLTQAIFPAVTRMVPEAKLYLVGDEPPTDLARTAGPNVIFTGCVREVRPYLEQASVVVAPLYRGGGMRVKVLDALAAGKAVVATPLAVEGLKVTSGEQLLLADRNEEFAKAAVQLLRHPEEAVALGSRARQWACTNLGWNRAIAERERLYDTLLDTRQLAQEHSVIL